MRLYIIFALLFNSVVHANKPVNNEHFTFAVIGDTGAGNRNQYMVASELENHEVDFVIHVGDIMYPNGYEEKDVNHKLFKPYRNINVPFLMIMGNHDSRSHSDDMLNGLKDHPKYNLPDRFYSAVMGNVKFIMIDSMILGHDSFWSGNSKWSKASGFDYIKNELNTDKEVVIVAHYPFYSVSKHGPQIPVAKKIKSFDVNNKIRMVLSGHSHVFEFMQHNGINQVVSGSGSKVDHGQPFKNLFEKGDLKFIEHTLGFTIFEFENNTFTFKFINHLGKVLFTTSL